MKRKLVKHKSAPTIYNEIPWEYCKIENVNSQVEFRWRTWKFELQ
jgi:hypothetical protein